MSTLNNSQSLAMTIAAQLLGSLSAQVCGAGAELDGIAEALAEIGFSIATPKIDGVGTQAAREAAIRMREMAHGLLTSGNAIMGTCSVVIGLCDAVEAEQSAREKLEASDG